MAQIALCDARGPLTDLLQKLSGDDGAAWLRNFNKFLRHEPVVSERTVVSRKFNTWKTVKLGTHKNRKDLLRALRHKAFLISDGAAYILKVMPLAKTETEIELVLVTVADLGGFTDWPRRDTIYERANELGLDLVPAEVGPQLLLAYSDELMEDSTIIGMEPIDSSSHKISVFNMSSPTGNDLLLGTSRGDPDDEGYPGRRWVFARKK